MPPPKKPVKSKQELEEERKEKVHWLISQGILRSRLIAEAMLRVPREDFIPSHYRDYAYMEVPLPIPGRNATISCPHSYPLFYEALNLDRGDKFLEVGAGSGYGAALAREIVGSEGYVVTVEIDPETYRFAKENLYKLGYTDIEIVLGDGSYGYPAKAPYDKICITASCRRIPEPLIRQLKPNGRLITPMGPPNSEQDLVLLVKGSDGELKISYIDKVLYVPLRGPYGY
ncbi:MAG: protein-L-isoaspartate O-methyltransferase [Candidatus Nezhaarchaeales archaeon]